MFQTAVIIGSGNVAYHLTRALMQVQVEVLMMYSRTPSHAAETGLRLNIPVTSDLKQLPTHASLYIYAVSDNALPEILAHELAPNALHVHTAGSVDLGVFPSHKPHCGVLYPLQTFSKNKELNFRDVPLFVEATTAQDAELLVQLASLLSNQVYRTTSAQRRQLHLAAVFACNFVNHLYAIANELVVSSELPFEVLRPLIAETASKIATLSPREAQTGPAIRRDSSVLQKHTSMLAGFPEYQEIYTMLSRSISGK